MQKNQIKKTENNSLLLFVGAFSLGAVFSYFASPTGSKKWKQLSEKWDEVKEYLWKQGLIENKNISLEDFRNQYLKKLTTSFTSMKENFESKTLEKELAHLAKLKRRRKQNQKQKFKGV
jgi:hypothetical protein